MKAKNIILESDKEIEESLQGHCTFDEDGCLSEFEGYISPEIHKNLS
jgi:hypothetical protein